MADEIKTESPELDSPIIDNKEVDNKEIDNKDEDKTMFDKFKQWLKGDKKEEQPKEEVKKEEVKTEEKIDSPLANIPADKLQKLIAMQEKMEAEEMQKELGEHIQTTMKDKAYKIPEDTKFQSKDEFDKYVSFAEKVIEANNYIKQADVKETKSGGVNNGKTPARDFEKEISDAITSDKSDKWQLVEQLRKERDSFKFAK